MLKRQSGAALVVALMITIVMGILAVGISKVATSGQRRENASFGSAVSQSNAVAGIEAAKGFVASVVGLVNEKRSYDENLFRPNNGTSVTDKTASFSVTTTKNNTTKTSSIVINSSGVANVYQGVEPELDSTSLKYGTNNGYNLWYRDANKWTPSKTNSIVAVNGNSNVKYRIEERANFVGVNPGMNNNANNIGYRYYRVTSRGADPNTGAVTILQTHIGILGGR